MSPDDDQARLRAVIQARAEERGWKNAELARRTGISEPQVGRLLRGSRTLTDGALRRFADAFGVTVLLLQAEAGVLTEDQMARIGARQPFADYIAGDPYLSDAAKDSLAAIYRDLVKASQASSRGRSASSRAD